MLRSAVVSALLLASFASLPAQTTPAVPSFELGNIPFLVNNPGLSPVQGDFNRDGKPDFVTAGTTSTTNGISLLLGNGDGTFRAPTVIGTTNSTIVDIALADFNNDGNLDILTINSANNFTVFYGNGNGTFQAPITTVTTGAPVTGTAGIFFSDGYTDVALADNNGDIEIFRNQGGRAFVLSNTIQSVLPANSTYPQILRLRAGDLNGTGVSDLAVLSNTSAYVFWNNGSGNFTKVLLNSSYGFATDLNIGYVNQDHMADIIIAYSCANSTIEAGHNNPSQCAGIDVYYGQGNNKTFYRNAVIDPGPSSVSSVSAEDVNGDGIADLISSGNQPDGTVDGIYLWLGRPDGSFTQTATIFNSGGIGPIVAGDFNRDGAIDFVQYVASDFEAYINGGQRGPCQTSSINPTVVVCNPVNNTYAQPVVHVQATAFDKNKITALQEYVDGQLDFSEPVTTLNYTSPALSPGSHLFVTKAFDSTGISFRSDRLVTVYNGIPGSTCPTAPETASICLPASSTTSSTTVQILANASTAAIPSAAQLYIDGKLVINNQGYCFPNNGGCTGGVTYIDTTQTLAPGNHYLVFKLFDASRNIYTAQKTVTVQ